MMMGSEYDYFDYKIYTNFAGSSIILKIILDCDDVVCVPRLRGELQLVAVEYAVPDELSATLVKESGPVYACAGFLFPVNDSGFNC